MEMQSVPRRTTRRQTLRSMGAFCVAPFVARLASAAEARPSAPEAPIRTITRGPKHHWFGYYDKLEFDPANRFVLANQVDFEHRTPGSDDRLRVGMVDTQKSDQWIDLGESHAWGWQQGCMLQWRPGSGTEVVWNDREGDRFVCHVLDVRTKAKRTLPRPIYTLSPDGRYGLTADFARIQNMRPGYGYVGLPDPHADTKAPKDSGVWRVDMQTGKTELIVSLAEVAARPYRGKPLTDQWNYFNHLLVNPDGTRFIVLHRWRRGVLEANRFRATSGFTTRMLTANMDGTDLYVLDPSGHTSHFIWKDPRNVCAWTQPAGRPAGFYLLEDKTDRVTPVGAGVMSRNGHNTYLPPPYNEWILNDTYPARETRKQTLYLFHTPSGRRYDLGHFYLPEAYRGEWRCDLHPRSSNDGRMVAIDSPHTGQGRQVHLIDVSAILA